MADMENPWRREMDEMDEWLRRHFLSKHCLFITKRLWDLLRREVFYGGCLLQKEMDGL